MIGTLTRLALLALAAAGALLASPVAGAAEGKPPAATIPVGKGLPVVVRSALFFNHIESFDDCRSDHLSSGRKDRRTHSSGERTTILSSSNSVGLQPDQKYCSDISIE